MSSWQHKICGSVQVLLFFGLVTMVLPAQDSLQKLSVPLNTGWEFRQLLPGLAPAANAPARSAAGAPSSSGAPTAEWHPAQVPGDVHLDLIANKLIPDPFFRDNEAKLQWIENADWEYRKTLSVTPEMLRHQHLDLIFDGLDAYCEVYLNDKLVLTADNMFRGWRVDAKALLKAGDNRLRIVFPSPIKAAEKLAATDPWRVKTTAEAKTYIRKAAYEYGWDWGPRFVTSGIWRPA